MSMETGPMSGPATIAELDRDAKNLTEGLGRELTELALERLTRFYQPLVDALKFSRVILEAVTDGALAFNPGGQIVLANSAGQRLFGLPPDIEGKTIEAVAELACIAEPVRQALATRQSTASHRITLERGGERWELDVALHFCRDARDGTGYWLLAVVRDLTSLKDLTFQVTQSSKLASLGTMLACIIHDVNNPLANILGYSELIAQELEEMHNPGLDLFRNRIRIVLEETMRARRIVENCLSFARYSAASQRPVDIPQLVEDTLDIFRSSLKQKGVKIETAIQPSLPAIYANRGLLQQVIFNLVKNGIDILGRDGIVWVRVRAEGNDLLIEVADNGPGIRPEHRNKVFSPFFTTKSEKEGTGLGLSIARTIVEEHGGKLTFDSVVGEGTTFVICLPIERRTSRRNGAPAAATSAQPAPASEKATLPRVLVVDDDPVMGGLIVDLVQRWYSVQAEVVFSVDAARASLAAAAYKVVFFNVRMNGIDPVSSFDRMKEAAAQTPIVTMAGSERPEFVEALLRRGSSVHLRKPFSLNTLLKVLGRLVPGQAMA